MLDVKTYIQLVLSKKQMTNTEFCKRINKVKKAIGDKGEFRVSNLSEIFNTDRGLDERTLLIFEKALELEMDSLVKLNKVSEREARKRNKELREVLKNVKIRY